jgi:hypothetical protein
VTRVNESLTADAASLMEATDSPAAAERLRDTAREARLSLGMTGVVSGLDSESRAKVVEALTEFGEKETERRQEYTASLQVSDHMLNVHGAIYLPGGSSREAGFTCTRESFCSRVECEPH